MSNIMTESQTLYILNEIGLQPVSDTYEVWMCLCPFHGNINTPAFAVNKTTGAFFCFNESCGASGDVLSLVRNVTGKSIFASARVISRARAGGGADIASAIQKNMSDEPFPTMSQSTLDGLMERYWKSPIAQEYMTGRGFSENTMLHYGIGYSPKQNMVTVPMHTASGDPIGFIGRSIEDKRFKNSDKLPKSRTLWNIHRAKRHRQVVITEASFDAMRVWQATGIEAVACLGSSFSDLHAEQIQKYFTHVVIMTDDDQKPTVKGNCRVCRADGRNACIGHNTGLNLGREVADKSRGLVVTWAHLDSLKRYDGMKDAGDMTDDQIRYAVDNAISNIEFQRITHSVV